MKKKLLIDEARDFLNFQEICPRKEHFCYLKKRFNLYCLLSKLRSRENLHNWLIVALLAALTDHLRYSIASDSFDVRFTP